MKPLSISMGMLALALLSGCEPDFVKEMKADGVRFRQRFPDSVQSYTFEGHQFQAAIRESNAPVQIVFVHGSPGQWEAWTSFLQDDALAARARLVAIDRIGFGGSRPGHAEPNLERQVEPLIPFLSDPKRRTILIGHSYGGPVVMKAAAMYPQNLLGVIVAAGSVSPALEEHRWYNVAASFIPVQWFLPQEMITSNREIWPLRQELQILQKQLPSVKVPVIVIQGKTDDLVPYGNAAYLRDAMPRGMVEIIERDNMGHLIPWEHPELVKLTIDLILERTKPPQPAAAAPPRNSSLQ